jgi:hypothetical protein
MCTNQKLIIKLHKYTEQPIKVCKNIIDKVPDSLKNSYVDHYENNPKSWFIDPIELDSSVSDILIAVDIEVDKYINEQKNIRQVNHNFRGMCHLAWNKKKEILKEKYQIEWKSPREMNPHVKFD